MVNVVFIDIYNQTDRMKTPDEYSKLISIEQQKLTLANTPEQKQDIQTHIQRLQYQREIAIIRRKIQQLS